MFILIRALIYATLFVGLVFLYVPGRILAGAGVVAPAASGWQQTAGWGIGTAGAVIAVWCILTFAIRGRGTPAPFDPPRRLVSTGPYTRVRNPMYLGAALVLSGAALLDRSWPMLGYAIGFLVVAHLFVVFYEEPALRAAFGQDYADYCARAGRWWPKAARGQTTPSRMDSVGKLGR
jgi:protein-S-isoprenylcysteine O-methyltransferase Ste14